MKELVSAENHAEMQWAASEVTGISNCFITLIGGWSGLLAPTCQVGTCQ